MAHTAIRLGYISVSGGGGGAGFQEYADLASFPPAGQLNRIYLAADTEKLYKWNGTSYIEISPSEVTSVNTQVGDVVLDKSDVGLGNVDNTSDLNKPISNDTQDALDTKENISNKSIDGTLSANSDTFYPSQKAVKTYVDSASAAIQNSLDASTYYHELHVNYDYTGAVVDGSPYKPFKTVQAAVNAAQLQNIGGNTAILIHLKKDITMVEDIVVNNAVSNLYIMPAVRNNTSSAPFKIIGSLTISGSQTNRVRVQDIEFAPTSGYALIINDTPGRHLFQNCGFVNGSVAGLAGTGVNLINTYRNFIEFVDCTIEGTLNIDGTPVAGTTVTLYRCKLSYANVIVNSPNIAVGMYDTYGIYGITHTAGALAITGMWGFSQTGFFNSTASLSGINFLSLANMSLQKPDLSFVSINKTGTCFYQLINTHRNESSDVLTGTRAVYGPTSTDSSYKMGVSGNWSPAVSNVAGALDQLAANKISVSQKGVANGVAPLNSLAKIDATYLPSYVDDVVEYANLAAFPPIGETGKLYIALDTNLVYRWTGSVYVEVSPSPAITWGSITGTLSNQTDLQSALNGKFDDPTGTTSQYIRGDGSLATFPTIINQANSLVTTVFNKSGAPIPKFSVVYISGGQGDMPTISLAQANNEANSSKTYGVVYADIPNMQSGQVIVSGSLTGLNTDQFNPTAPTGDVNGVALYLSPTVPGGVTTTKPSAPDHMVYVATIVRTHQNEGVVEVRIQNGFELQELHNVQIPNGSAQNNQVLKYDSATNLWKNKYIGLASDIEETSFSIANNQAIASNITNFSFSNVIVRSFNAVVSVKIDADSDLYEIFEIHGIQKGSEWDLSISSSGDSTGIMFSITNSGQLQYTSQNYSGFLSGAMKFRAITTSA